MPIYECIIIFTEYTKTITKKLKFINVKILYLLTS